jgi:hypothetical protein
VKGIALVLLLAVLLFATSCRGGKEDETDSPDRPVVPQEGVSHDTPVVPVPQDNHVFLTPEVRPGLRNIPITWGFNSALYGSPLFLTFQVVTEGGHRGAWERGDIQAFLRNYFDVQLEGVYVSDELLTNNPPDIFITQPWRARRDTLTRTIPEEMIRRYAPNYAMLLDRHKGWEVSRAANGEQYALNTFDAYHRDLDVFSVYRLEWLEELNLPLPGTGQLQQVADRVYFSPESFTLHEFLLIMDAFTRDEPNLRPPTPRIRQTWGDTAVLAEQKTWGMEVNSNLDAFQAIAPILGMFGVNTSIMEENGRAVPFFASQGYRAALLFLEDLVARDIVFAYGGEEQNQVFVCYFLRTGWTAVRTRDLYNVVNDALGRDPNRKILITPPENNGPGYRGAGLLQGSSPFNTDGKAWFIPDRVDDNTLSRILNIFDEFSFNPEIHSIITLGIYDDSPHFADIAYQSRFSWSGEPYQSTVKLLRSPSFINREGVFFTGIVDGVTFPQHLHGEFEAVSRFARSDAGIQLNLLPARENAQGVFAEERAYLDSRYWDALAGGLSFNITESMWGSCVVSWYLLNILHGQISVALSWDEYMEALNENGLQEYIDLFSRFPH